MASGYRWAIYFTWQDGTEDSVCAETAHERDTNIAAMVKSGNFKSIEYCRIYADGEYGINKKII